MAAMSTVRCRYARIAPLRTLHLQELNAQCRYDAAHTRKGTAHYLLRREDRDVGYGAVKDVHEGGGTLFEFYLLPPFRSDAAPLLQQLVDTSRADALESQSNDLFYTALARQRGGVPASDTILYGAGGSNTLQVTDAVIRRRHRKDRVFEHTVEPVGDFVVEAGGEVVGTGGFLLHYNRPFADLFMEVRQDARRRGYGSLLIQQLVVECYLAKRVPAARTSIDNIASQRTLLKGGLRECGRMLRLSLSRV